MSASSPALVYHMLRGLLIVCTATQLIQHHATWVNTALLATLVYRHVEKAHAVSKHDACICPQLQLYEADALTPAPSQLEGTSLPAGTCCRPSTH